MYDVSLRSSTFKAPRTKPLIVKAPTNFQQHSDFLEPNSSLTQSIDYIFHNNQKWRPQHEKTSSRRCTPWCHLCLRASTRVSLSLIPAAFRLLIFFVGQLGRVAVIGGSEDYTGAPYFSAMASAKLGCDMVHITRLETVVETKLMKCSLT
jgi:hypothetical protein